MPHHFVNRPRFQAIDRTTSSLRHQFTWESVNALIYVIGGGMFIWGSVLFFPLFEERADRGVWIFFFASLLYLVVTGPETNVRPTSQARKGDLLRPSVSICRGTNFIAPSLVLGGCRGATPGEVPASLATRPHGRRRIIDGVVLQFAGSRSRSTKSGRRRVRRAPQRGLRASELLEWSLRGAHLRWPAP